MQVISAYAIDTFNLHQCPKYKYKYNLTVNTQLILLILVVIVGKNWGCKMHGNSDGILLRFPSYDISVVVVYVLSLITRTSCWPTHKTLLYRIVLNMI